MTIRRRLSAFLLFCLLVPALPANAQPRPAPEDASGWQEKPLATASRHMVAAADPRAVEAGLTMLRAGGSAIDAAIATQLVLNLVEPQSSGIGGGAFLLHHDNAAGKLIAYDGRETAPAAATPNLFLKPDGTPMKFRDAMVGGRAVGAPGVVAMLAKAHTAHGKLEWAELFAPAIALARDGFIVGPRLAGMLAGPRGARLRAQPSTADYFFPGGEPLIAGARLRNPAFADTLERLAQGGADAFYRDEIARDIAMAVQRHATNPGLLSETDLAGYMAKTRDPICIAYRVWRVCGMGPPSSGGIAVGQILSLLARFDLPSMTPDTPAPWHLIAEASKLAFADRNRYVADSDFVEVPIFALLSPTYMDERAARIDPRTALPVPIEAGEPLRRARRNIAPDTTDGRPGTSHISVVDGDGHAVSMTTSIEGAFGAHLMVRGFLLNNQLTDFSFRPKIDGQPVANAVAPGKRPRSSMAPTIVYDSSGDLRLVVGSPGGSRIIGYVAKTIIAVLDWNMDPQAAIDLPHLVNRNGATDIESGATSRRFDAAIADSLVDRGQEVRRRELNSGLHAITIIDGVLYGSADPRREGIAKGD